MPKRRLLNQAEAERRLKEIRALLRKPKSTTTFELDDDELTWAYRHAHPKDKAKLDALGPDEVRQKAKRWVSNMLRAVLRGQKWRLD